MRTEMSLTRGDAHNPSSQWSEDGQASEDSEAKRAHQYHEAGQSRSFEDGGQIDFREKDREKKSVPSALDRAHQSL